MKLGYIIAGFLFLSNPNVGIIDILPDFIGYFLIIKGIFPSQIFVPQLENSQNNFQKLFIIDTIKFILSFLLMFNINTLPLLLVFSFAVVELLFLFPAINDLFEGVSYAAVRFGNKFVLESKKIKKVVKDAGSGEYQIKEVDVEKVEKVRLITFIFIIAKTVLSIVPTLADLQLFENTGDVEVYSIRIADFNNIIALLSCIICTVFSVIWICSFLPYFRKIRKDRTFFDGIEKEYRGQLELFPDIPLGFHFKHITVVMSAMIISYCSPIFDGVTVFPKLISAAFAVSAAVLLSKFAKKTVIAAFPAVITILLSIIQTVFQTKYFIVSGYVPEDSFWIAPASRIYFSIKICSLVENILMLSVFIILFSVLYSCWKSDCKKSDAQIKPDSFSSEERQSLKKRFILSVSLTLPVCLLWAIYPQLVLYISSASPALFFISVLWAALSVFFVSDIYSNFYKKCFPFK